MTRSMSRRVFPTLFVAMILALVRTAWAQEEVGDPKRGTVGEESEGEEEQMDSVSRSNRRWEVGFKAGAVGFVGADVAHRALGVSLRYHLTPRIAIEPELMYMWAPVECRGVLPISSSPGGPAAFYVEGSSACAERGSYDKDFMLTTDLVYSFKDPVERYVPYISIGFGVIQTRLKTVNVTTPWFVWDGTDWVPEDIESEVFELSREFDWWWYGAAGGIRIRLAGRLHFSPELRIGRDTVFLTANVTYAF